MAEVDHDKAAIALGTTTGSGAVAGFLIGLPFGPVGMIAGLAIGGGAGFLAGAGLWLAEWLTGGTVIADENRGDAGQVEQEPEKMWNRESLMSEEGWRAADMAGLAETYSTITGNSVTAQEIQSGLLDLVFGESDTILQTSEQAIARMVANGTLALKINGMIRELKDFGRQMNAGDKEFLGELASLARGGSLEIGGMTFSGASPDGLSEFERYLKAAQWGVGFEGEDAAVTQAIRERYVPAEDGQGPLGVKTMELADSVFEQSRARRIAETQIDARGRQAELELLSQWTNAKRQAEATYAGIKSAEALKTDNIRANSAITGYLISQERTKAMSLQTARAAAAGVQLSGTTFGVQMAEAMRYDMEALMRTTIDENMDGVIQANEVMGGLAGTMVGDELVYSNGVTGALAQIGLPTAPSGMTISDMFLSMGANAELRQLRDQVWTAVRDINVNLINLASDINLNAGAGTVQGIADDTGIESIGGGWIRGDRLATFNDPTGALMDGVFSGEIGLQVGERRAGVADTWQNIMSRFQNAATQAGGEFNAFAEWYNPATAPVGGAGGVFNEAAFRWAVDSIQADYAGVSAWEMFTGALNVVGSAGSIMNSLMSIGRNFGGGIQMNSGLGTKLTPTGKF